jgi:hypothetical protein
VRGHCESYLLRLAWLITSLLLATGDPIGFLDLPYQRLSLAGDLLGVLLGQLVPIVFGSDRKLLPVVFNSVSIQSILLLDFYVPRRPSAIQLLPLPVDLRCSRLSIRLPC